MAAPAPPPASLNTAATVFAAGSALHLENSGANGANGRMGVNGARGTYPSGHGGNAEAGTDGARGADGGDILLTLAVDGDKVVVGGVLEPARNSGRPRAPVHHDFKLDDPYASISLASAGGRGGDAGHGGKGGDGSDGCPGTNATKLTPGRNGTPGGAGGAAGAGGNGGAGGRGGAVVVRVDEADMDLLMLLSTAKPHVDGGTGGRPGGAGTPGRGGFGGAGGAPMQFTERLLDSSGNRFNRETLQPGGSRGPDGPPGRSASAGVLGPPGPPGAYILRVAHADGIQDYPQRYDLAINADSVVLTPQFDFGVIEPGSKMALTYDLVNTGAMPTPVRRDTGTIYCALASNRWAHFDWVADRVFLPGFLSVGEHSPLPAPLVWTVKDILRPTFGNALMAAGVLEHRAIVARVNHQFDRVAAQQTPFIVQFPVQASIVVGPSCASEAGQEAPLCFSVRNIGSQPLGVHSSSRRRLVLRLYLHGFRRSPVHAHSTLQSPTSDASIPLTDKDVGKTTSVTGDDDDDDDDNDNNDNDDDDDDDDDLKDTTPYDDAIRVSPAELTTADVQFRDAKGNLAHSHCLSFEIPQLAPGDSHAVSATVAFGPEALPWSRAHLRLAVDIGAPWSATLPTPHTAPVKTIQERPFDFLLSDAYTGSSSRRGGTAEFLLCVNNRTCGAEVRAWRHLAALLGTVARVWNVDMYGGLPLRAEQLLDDFAGRTIVILNTRRLHNERLARVAMDDVDVGDMLAGVRDFGIHFYILGSLQSVDMARLLMPGDTSAILPGDGSDEGLRADAIPHSRTSDPLVHDSVKSFLKNIDHSASVLGEQAKSMADVAVAALAAEKQHQPQQQTGQQSQQHSQPLYRPHETGTSSASSSVGAGSSRSLLSPTTWHRSFSRHRSASSTASEVAAAALKGPVAMAASEPALVKGWLEKRGHFNTSYRLRFWALRPDTATLCWYKTAKDSAPQGMIWLAGGKFHVGRGEKPGDLDLAKFHFVPASSAERSYTFWMSDACVKANADLSTQSSADSTATIAHSADEWMQELCALQHDDDDDDDDDNNNEDGNRKDDRKRNVAVPGESSVEGMAGHESPSSAHDAVDETVAVGDELRGWLVSRDTLLRRSRRRWCVLKPTSLTVFANAKEDATAKRIIPLTHFAVDRVSEVTAAAGSTPTEAETLSFLVRTPDMLCTFEALSPASLALWVETLQLIGERAAAPQRIEDMIDDAVGDDSRSFSVHGDRGMGSTTMLERGAAGPVASSRERGGVVSGDMPRNTGQWLKAAPVAATETVSAARKGSSSVVVRPSVEVLRSVGDGSATPSAHRQTSDPVCGEVIDEIRVREAYMFFGKPKEEDLVRYARQIAEHYEQHFPALRVVIVYHFHPSKVGGIMRSDWDLGTIEVRRSLDHDHPSVVVHEVPEAVVHSPAFILGLSNLFHLLKTVSFAKKLHIFAKVLPNQPTDAEQKRVGSALALAIVSDLLDEQSSYRVTTGIVAGTSIAGDGSSGGSTSASAGAEADGKDLGPSRADEPLVESTASSTNVTRTTTPVADETNSASPAPTEDSLTASASSSTSGMLTEVKWTGVWSKRRLMEEGLVRLGAFCNQWYGADAQTGLPPECVKRSLLVAMAVQLVCISKRLSSGWDMVSPKRRGALINSVTLEQVDVLLRQLAFKHTEDFKALRDRVGKRASEEKAAKKKAGVSPEQHFEMLRTQRALVGLPSGPTAGGSSPAASSSSDATVSSLCGQSVPLNNTMYAWPASHVVLSRAEYLALRPSPAPHMHLPRVVAREFASPAERQATLDGARKEQEQAGLLLFSV